MIPSLSLRVIQVWGILHSLLTSAMVKPSDFADMSTPDRIWGGTVSYVIDDLAITISLCLVMDTCCHTLDVVSTQYLPRCYRNTTSWMLLPVCGRAPHIHYLVCNHISTGALCIPYGYHMTGWNLKDVLGLLMVEDICSELRAFYSVLCVRIPFLCKRLDWHSGLMIKLWMTLLAKSTSCWN